MSLWTPDGEHDVPRQNDTPEAPSDTPPGYEDLNDEQRAQAAQIAEEMEEARQRISQTPASVVVLNHMMGLYELGAIHLSSEPANVTEAKVAIDAMAAIAHALEGRLGDEETTVKEALTQIQMAWVQISEQTSPASTD